MGQLRNTCGLRVLWLDGHSSDHWFRSHQICDFMWTAFRRMQRDGWDGSDSRAEVADVIPIQLGILARPAGGAR